MKTALDGLTDIRESKGKPGFKYFYFNNSHRFAFKLSKKFEQPTCIFAALLLKLH